MPNYLQTMDALKTKFIESQNSMNTAKYPFMQYHYYEKIEYFVDKEIEFKQLLFAVKLVKTTILFVDPQTQIKVYLSDNDIANMINHLSDDSLKKHIVSFLQKIIDGKKLRKLEFSIHGKTFRISGIPFDVKYNEIICNNPADTKINGNDFIAMINLVLEKERADTNPNKLKQTAKKYIRQKNS